MGKSKKTIIFGVILSVALLAGSSLVFAGTQTFEAVAANFNFFVNGQNVKPAEQPVVIDGKTYLPVRALGEVLDKRIGWDADSKTVVIEELLADGVYKAAEPEFNEHGWKAMVNLTVKDGIITAVKYDEINKEGTYKSKDEAYLQQYKDVTKADMLEKINQLETSLVNAQSVGVVDAVSGATYASYSFQSLVQKALEAGPVSED